MGYLISETTKEERARYESGIEGPTREGCGYEIR